MDKRAQLSEGIEDVALLGVQEMKKFLETYQGDNPVAVKRVGVGAAAVKNYLDKFSAQNGLLGLMMGAAERANVSSEQALEMRRGMLAFKRFCKTNSYGFSDPLRPPRQR